MTDLIEAQLLRLVREYQSMNGSQVAVLDRPPTALEFSQMVALSRPVVFKTDSSIPDYKLWTADYLARKLGDKKISVSVTPDGNADSLHEVVADDGARTTYFVEPHNEHMLLRDFIAQLSAKESEGAELPREVLYLQSQNGNVYSPYEEEPEYAALQDDIPSTLPWATEALGEEPDAVNLWIGSSRSRTSLHKDNYENVYSVVSGIKIFTVLPPVEGVLLGTRLYPHATWTRPSTDSGSPLTLTPSPISTPSIPWTSFDPSIPRPSVYTAADRTQLTKPLAINVPEGYSLYLPAQWYHHVRQSPPLDEDRKHEPCIALNWWFDQSYLGERAVVRQFIEGLARSIGWIEDGWKEDEDSDVEPSLVPGAANAEVPSTAQAAVVEESVRIPDDREDEDDSAREQRLKREGRLQTLRALAQTDDQGSAPSTTRESEDDAQRGRDLVASFMSSTDEPRSDDDER